MVKSRKKNLLVSILWY